MLAPCCLLLAACYRPLACYKSESPYHGYRPNTVPPSAPVSVIVMDVVLYYALYRYFSFHCAKRGVRFWLHMCMPSNLILLG